MDNGHAISLTTGIVYSNWVRQKFALRMCAKSWDSSYQELLHLFSQPDLQQRRLYPDLCTMFRVINGLFHLPDDILVPQTSNIYTRSSNSQTYTCPFAHTCSYFNSFVPRTIRAWNSLTLTVTSTNSLASFKLGLPSTFVLAICYFVSIAYMQKLL